MNDVLLNLIKNAVDANAGNITLSSKYIEETVTISVEDDGSGIFSTELPRIFDPFYTTKSEGKGTGLGLSISRDYMIAQGGRIEAESTTGEHHYTRFTLTFPVPKK
ncbi:ATP-binding protein [Candidatus Peregrinibacteria bacterium]|nr:ATP-binding protein [Candidatus Peregrinibacteria bacterium]